MVCSWVRVRPRPSRPATRTRQAARRCAYRSMVPGGLSQVGQLRGETGVFDSARADFGWKLLTTFWFLVVPCWLSQAGGYGGRRYRRIEQAPLSLPWPLDDASHIGPSRSLTGFQLPQIGNDLVSRPTRRADRLDQRPVGMTLAVLANRNPFQKHLRPPVRGSIESCGN